MTKDASETCSDCGPWKTIEETSNARVDNMRAPVLALNPQILLKFPRFQSGWNK